LLVDAVALGLVENEQEENGLLLFAVADSNALFGEVKGSADAHVLLEDWPIEGLSEGHCCIVFYFILLVDTDHVFGARLQEDFADKLRMASQHDNEFKVAVGLQNNLL